MAAFAWASVNLACEDVSGSGLVRAHFLRDECPQGTPTDLSNYAFDAGYLATGRFAGILEIIVQEHRVDVEETDGMVIRFSLQRELNAGTLVVDRDQIVRANPNQPLIVRTSTSRDDANVALSLFTTCPEFPTHFAQTGVFTIDKITLAADPQDTGTGERLAGTVTATLTNSAELVPIGTLDAIFDFAPPRRPLTDFK